MIAASVGFLGIKWTWFVVFKMVAEFSMGIAIKLMCENGRIHYRDLPALFGFGPDIVEPGIDLEMQGRG